MMRSNLLVLAIVLNLVRPVYAEAPSIYDYWLGDHIIEYPLSELDVITSDFDGFLSQAFIKLNAPQKTEVVLTFRKPSYTLDYIEHDWIDRDQSAPTALGLPKMSEFIFGKTRVRDIQAAFDQDGFHYACRQLQPISGGLLTFISFEHPDHRDAVYTFVAEFSRELADRGLVDLNNVDLRQAILVSAIVSRPDYPDEFWCDERIPYSAKPTGVDLEIPEIERFEDFLPHNSRIAKTNPWELVTDPYVMISKEGALTAGDRLFIMPDPKNCAQAEFLAWAHTDEDEALLALKGSEITGAFNMLMAQQNRLPLDVPLILSNALYAPIEDRDWPPFSIGTFVLGPVNFERIITTETNPSVYGFSLEFSESVAGMRDNYWSLEGLFAAGSEAIRMCEERAQ